MIKYFFTFDFSLYLRLIYFPQEYFFVLEKYQFKKKLYLC